MKSGENLYNAFDEYLKRESKEQQEEIKAADPRIFEDSDRFKRKMNRVFRERMGIKDRIPHPDVDNLYERIRSRIVRVFFVIARFIRKY